MHIQSRYGAHLILIVEAETKADAESYAQDYCDTEENEEYMVIESKITSINIFEVLATDINR